MALADTFAGDGDLHNRTTTTGGATWTVHAGTADTSGGQARWTDTGGTTVHATVDFAAADMDVQVTFATVASSGMALLARFTDASNHWFVNNDGVTWKLWCRTGGTSLAESNTYTAAQANGDVVRIVAEGTASGAVKVYINGTLRITSSANETVNGTATRCGIANNFFTSPRYDDFSADAPSAGGPVGPLAGSRLLGGALTGGRLMPL